MPRRLLPLARAVAATVLLASSGCGLLGDDDAAPTTTAAATTTTTTPATEVLDAGAAPRKGLALRFRAGDTTTATFTFDLDVTQASGGEEQVLDTPVVREVVRFTVDRVEGDEAVVSFAFAEVAVGREGTSLTDQEHLELTVALQDLVGLGGTGRVTARGAFRSFAYDVPDGLDPSVTATLQQFEEQLPSLAVPLPDEPLGVGGRWRTTGRTTLAGVVLDQVTTYEITALTDTGVSYDVATTQRAASQPLEAPGLPQGATARLVSSDVTGSGSGSLQLDALVAASTSTLTGTQEVELVRGTEPAVRLTQQLDVAVAVAVGA